MTRVGLLVCLISIIASTARAQETDTERAAARDVLKKMAALEESLDVPGIVAKLVGANREYIVKQIPHLSSLLCDTVEEVIGQSEVIVVGNQSAEFSDAVTKCRPDQIVIDLVRLPIYGSLLQADYRGICW